MWHTATISLQRDLDNITECSSAPCDPYITKIKFGSESGAPGQRFFIDDFMVTNEMGAASKVFYEADFEMSSQVYEWYSGYWAATGYYSPNSLKVPGTTMVDKYFEYFSQDYRYIDFVYRTYEDSSFYLKIRSDKPIDNYYTDWNMTEISIEASQNVWTEKHIDLNDYGLGDTRVKRIEFYSSVGPVWIDDFLISNEVPGVCTDCEIDYAGVQFNTKYFSDFEYGTGGWMPAGGSTLSLNTTNETSYSGMMSLVLGNSSNLVANFTPGYEAPSIPTSSYPYMSFAYRATGGTMKYRIGSTWYDIPNFAADNAWHTVA